MAQPSLFCGNYYIIGLPNLVEVSLMSIHEIINNHIVLTVAPEDDGKSLRLLLRRLRLSRAALHRFKAGGAVLVNDQPRRANEQVFAGETLHISLDDLQSSNIIPEQADLEVLYEDNAILACSKPAGIPVHPSLRHHTGTLANHIAGYLQNSGNVHLVNRLDKDTSGIVLVAKNAFFKQRLCHSHEQMTKTYLALAHGQFTTLSGEIDAPIARETPGEIRRCVRADGREARTSFEVLTQQENFVLLQVTLHTGRTHQIRVHLAHLGHPLLGDTLYGGKTDLISRHALHAWRLAFLHPVTKNPLEIIASPPEDFASLCGLADKLP
jgi:23S rRNA pseudouridine1911/1915/1917 synthase